jgi:hypothetical protein
VVVLAGVAGAISFSHMAQLAAEHDQTGWRAVAFPLSVDGLELVASLDILARRRVGQRPGLLPWTALVVGTAASLAANVAVGGDDLVGRLLAGWPAVALLVSIKLLFEMFDHDEGGTDGRDDQRTSSVRGDVPGTVRGPVGTSSPSSGTSVARRTVEVGSSAPDAVAGRLGRSVESGGGPAAPADVRGVADLISAARAARIALAAEGRSLSRDALADRIRDDGHAVSNARASLSTRILRAEESATSPTPCRYTSDASEQPNDTSHDSIGSLPVLGGITTVDQRPQ